MLLDALRAELFRFSRHTTAWLWALFVVPVSMAISSIFFELFIARQLKAAGEAIPAKLTENTLTALNLGRVVSEQAMQLAGINLLAFFLIGAAAIAAADYRWETWRLIRPRNSRENLVLGKALAIAVIGLIPLLLYLFCDLLARIIVATIESREIILGFRIDQALLTIVMVLVSWLRVIQVGLIALVAAIATRSLFGGFVIPIAFSVGMFMVERMMLGLGWAPNEWRTLLLFPSGAYQTIQSYLANGPYSALDAVKGLIGLLIWIGLPLVLSVWLFKRQNLSKE